MNAPVNPSLLAARRLADPITTATARVAPTWPLDQLIAVNPYWGWVGQAMPDAAATLGTLAGTRLTMPREWFSAQWAAGRLQRQHLRAAVALETLETPAVTAEIEAGAAELVSALAEPSAPLPRLRP